MVLTITKSKNSANFYVRKSVRKGKKKKKKEIYSSLSESKLIGLNERRICNIGYIF